MYNVFIRKLIKLNFYLSEQIDEDNWYFHKENIVLCLTSPHKGTDFKWMLRADTKEEFDRWSNAQFEMYFNTPGEFEDVLKELDYFIKYGYED